MREQNCSLVLYDFFKKYFPNGNPTSWQYPLLNYFEFHVWVFHFSFVHFFAPFMGFWFWWGIRVNGFAFVTYISHITFFAKSWNQVNSSRFISTNLSRLKLRQYQIWSFRFKATKLSWFMPMKSSIFRIWISVLGQSRSSHFRKLGLQPKA